VSRLLHDGFIEAKAYGQTDVFRSAVLFARSEGILPAPESAHAIHGAIVEALAAREAGEKKVILFNLSGHGYFDLTAYDAYLGNRLDDVEYPAGALEASLKCVPSVG
jgi:tryptophan synthase beta chain